MYSMKTFITVLLSVAFFSCNNINHQSVPKESHREGLVIQGSVETSKELTEQLQKFEVDDFPVTDEMFVQEKSESSARKIKSEDLSSYDKVWFSNDTLKQNLIFELYTDYHRLVTYCFYNDQIPTDIIQRIELHTSNNEIAGIEQKSKAMNGLLSQATVIPSNYFTTHKGFQLGSPKQKAIETYGQPDKEFKQNEVKILEWNFKGDIIDDEKFPNNKPVAMRSYGHQITMYFAKEKLVGLILFNDIP